MLEFNVDAAPVENTTVPPAIEIGVLSESVFVSGRVEVSVQVDIPAREVEEQVP